MKEYISHSERETIALGRSFAETLKPGDVVCLRGGLGAGKTHFVKGIASFFGIEETAVNSPTFTLINEYNGEVPVYHFDCYRLENEQEALEIGAEDYFYGDGISVIEWPERIASLIPENAIFVAINNEGKNKRNIRILEP